MRIQRVAFCALVFFIVFCSSASSPGWSADSQPIRTDTGLTLDEALALAARNRQELVAFRADLDAAATKLKYAGRPPNPELGVEWDNLGGDLPPDEVREATISLNQPLEIGGKTAARKDKSQAEILRLQREQTTVWLDIAAETSLAFLEVLGARERLTLQQEAERIASELADITRERVAAGDLAATEETRAEARWAETAAETQKCKRFLTEAELELATALAEPDRVAVSAIGSLHQELSIPDLKILLTEVQSSPLLAQRRSETRLATAGLALEQANAWSDPAVSLALRDFSGEDARAVTVAFSISLPFFQRNQAAVAEAGAAARKAKTDEEATTRRLRTQLIKAHTVLTAAGQEARALRNDVLSRAATAAEAVREGFRAGKFRYSDVLEASQSLVAVRVLHLEAVLDLNRAAIALDRLLGKPSIPEFADNASSSSLDRRTP